MPTTPAWRAAALAAIATLVSPGATSAVGAQTASPPASQPTVRYPETRRGEQVDDYHGTRIADPYRWLEDTDSPETRAWVEAENRVTFAYLSGIPERAQLKSRLTELWNYPKYGVPVRRGSWYFFRQNSGLQNQAVLYVQKALRDPARALIDPNTLSADGTVALTLTEPSEDGKYLAYGVASSGSDWQEFRVRLVATGQDLADTLRWIKFSGLAWTKDGKGFFYSRYDAPADSAGSPLRSPNRGQKLYYHRLGRPQSADELIFESKEHPEWLVTARVSDDGQFLVLKLSDGAAERNRLYLVDLDSPHSPKVSNPMVRLIDNADAAYDFIDNAGNVFFVRTTRGAPRGRVVAIDINDKNPATWRTTIQESDDALLGVTAVNNELVATYLHDAHSVVRFYSPFGAPLGELPLPGIGTVDAVSGHPLDREMFYSFTSFLQPTTVYRFDFRRNRPEVLRQPVVPGFDAERYETKQVFYSSKDGTRVPMFVTARKGLTLNGNTPTLLYGYGGFDIPLTPEFSPVLLAWLELGGVYAVPSLRGGGEYGQQWHEGGMLAKKQNVFDDFIAAAEFLIKERYTSPAKLAIQGGSNGGLLVGAAMTQRPELFGVALPAVGVMDMLRFHRFTIGWAWVPEYGSADDSAQFEVLRRYSPLHNIRPGTRYPATLVTTADHDDRVVPGHSFKFAAALQAAQAGPAPTLIRIETKAGHGGGKPTSKQIEVAADELAFLVRNLGMTGATTP